MGLGYIRGGGGGGINSADVTAYKADVLKGKRTITADSGDEVAEGTMPDNTGINTNGTVPGISSAYPNTPTRPGTGLQLQTATDGVKRINISPPKGYYQGNNGSYVNRPASEFGNATAAQVLSGRKFTSENGLNISGSIPSKAAATYYPTTSDQTIAANQYLTGAQTIKAVGQQNLVAGNIKKGVTVYVTNGSGNIFAVTGTWEGYVAEATDLYYRGIAQNIQQYSGYGDSVIFDNGQITIPQNTSGFGFVTKTAVNMTGYTKIIVEGNWRAYVSNSGYNQHPILIAELVNSATDNVSTKYLTLATQDYGTRSDTITWTSYTFTFTAQSVSKYIRLLFKNEATYGKYSGFITRIRLAR